MPDAPTVTRGRWARRLALVATVAAVVAVLSACSHTTLRQDAMDPRGPDAAKLYNLVWPVFVVAGVVFFASFAGIASGAGNVALNLAFTAAVVLASVWLSVVSLRLYQGEAR